MIVGVIVKELIFHFQAHNNNAFIFHSWNKCNKYVGDFIYECKLLSTVEEMCVHFLYNIKNS